MLAPYPTPSNVAPDEQALADIALLTDVIRAIRNIRAEFRVEPQRPVDVIFSSPADSTVLQDSFAAIRQLARVRSIAFASSGEAHEGKGPGPAAVPAANDAVKLVVGRTTVMLSLGSAVDVAAERARLVAEAEEIAKHLAGLEARLNNEQFVSKAPADVVERERQRLDDGRARVARIQEVLADLGA